MSEPLQLDDLNLVQRLVIGVPTLCAWNIVCGSTNTDVTVGNCEVCVTT